MKYATVTIVMFALVVCMGCDETGGIVQTKIAAPGFSLATMDNKPFILDRQQGRDVVMVFWATWCGWCKKQMVELEDLNNSLADNNVSCALVLSDTENLEEARRITESLNLESPILLDCGSEVTEEYRVKGFPTTVVVNAEGNVVYYKAGYSPDIVQEVRSLLE